MCTVVILHRPGHAWPLLLAANRDEMTGRPWRTPARHWPDRPQITGGLDEQAGGTWLGVNEAGLIAAILNRPSSLGPEAGKRSRGELPLTALEAGRSGGRRHASRGTGCQGLPQLQHGDRRAGGRFLAACRWRRGCGAIPRSTRYPKASTCSPAYDLDDMASPRVRRHLPLFRAAPVPGTGLRPVVRLDRAARRPQHRIDRHRKRRHDHRRRFGLRHRLQFPDRLGKSEIDPIWMFAAGQPDKVSFDQVLPTPPIVFSRQFH